MKAPMKWLKEYVEIDMDAQSYAEKMIMSGTGVEGVDNTGAGFDGVVVGKVLTCVMHPDSDHLHICTVDVGAEEPSQIVCGAPNVAAGQLVPVALPGAHLPGGVKIKAGKLRGVASNGMICSGPELGVPEGLYPHCGEAGIVVISEDVAPGTDVKDVFGLGDDVIDFEVLANRPDCLSVWGLARESSAVLNTHCLMPEITVEETGKGQFSDYASVKVLDDALCPRYCARVIENVKIGPSPMWMREYLHGAGVRPINNIVDITNFVMLETGHPMHAFDLSKVKDHEIVVRRALPGEKLTTLDGKVHKLTPDMLVIADAEKATGLAGIMGGEESEIVGDTHAVLFECAAFDRTSSRLTSRALGVRTEASGRFEKGVCVEDTNEALERACMLVNMLECGQVVPGTFDHYPNPALPRTVEADVGRVNRLISANLSADEMQDILERLYIETDVCENTLTCRIPPQRGDIDGEADIAEEVLRLYGYAHIPSTLMTGETMAGMRSPAQKLSDRMKNALVGMGWYEAVTFSFISPRWLTVLPEDWRRDPVALRNPLGEDTSDMRTSLMPSMLNVLSTNLNRGNANVKLFELAPVFRKAGDGMLPEENKVLCLGMYGDDADFYALKDACACLLSVFGLSPTVTAGGDLYYHPGRKAILTEDGAPVAQLGEIHPDVAEAFGIGEKRVYIAEIDVKAVMDLQKPIPPVKALPRFPAVSRDLALVMDEKIGVGPVMEALRRAAGKRLESIAVFDVYRGVQLGLGRKSVAFSLFFRDPEKTLEDAEISAMMDKVLAVAEKEFGAEIRK